MAGSKKNSPGCGSCCTSPATLTVVVKGCNGAGNPLVAGVSGATVVYNGVTQTTGGTATVTFAIPDTAGHTLTVSATRFATSTQTVTVNPLADTTVEVDLTADTGYVCCPTCTPTPVKQTLTLTDAVGTLTLTWDSGSGGRWTACRDAVTGTFRPIGDPAHPAFGCSTTASVNVAVRYTLLCHGGSGGTQWSIALLSGGFQDGTGGCWGCYATTACSGFPWPCNGIPTNTVASSATCSPLSLTFTSLGVPYNTSSVGNTITVTE